ncbi:DUF3180 domain-containing protein [Saxibacter everestensis]|uniref:DUF3180 domain-containing protein n=1 Tax=Saxibacter everestensis TaxID=2909229 RepID=A0ABY8QRH5_9MICO|nr:DUF3180 domain-containing protein [Brevibacteriaceae bacterium ZFBP1038]
MQATKFRNLLLGALVGAVIGFVVFRILEAAGSQLPGLPVVAIVGMVVLGLALLVFGWPVRRWTSGDRDKPLDPLRAARTLVMAKAASGAGSLIAGWYAGSTAYLLFAVGTAARREQGLQMLIAVLAAVFLVTTGLVVERFCQLPPDDNDNDKEGAQDSV